jgi:carboxyl-terminal processing protease
LNEAERREERAADEKRLTAREAGKGTGKEAAAARSAALGDDGLQPGERKLATELAAEKTRKDAKDVLLEEAVNILGDELAVMKTGVGLTAGIEHGPVLPLQ